MPEMIDYINEQPAVMRHIMENREQVTGPFVKLFSSNNIRRVYITGSGSSSHVGIIIKHFMERLLDIEVSFSVPSYFNNYEVVNRGNTYEPGEVLFIAISQGGKSSATVEAVRKAKAAGAACLTVTSELGSPITRETSDIVHVLCGDEKVPPETKGYMASMFTLMLCVIETALQKGMISRQKHSDYINELVSITGNIHNIISNTENWYRKHRQELMAATKFMFIGYGANNGTVLESTIKVHETVRRPSMGYELEEFMHGPDMAVDKDSYLFFIASKGIGLARMKKLNDYYSSITSHRFLVIDESDPYKTDRDIAAHFTNTEDLSPLEYVVPFQVLSYRLATDLGIDTSVVTYPGFSTAMVSKIN